MLAIRGAITINEDSETEISVKTLKLLKRVFDENRIIYPDSSVISCIFSSTKDITAYYPATAARRGGYSFPMFSCVEPDIAGSLKLCIRVLIHINTDGIKIPQKHIYLDGAAILRPDLQQDQRL